ncbi:ABC transporter substrate-binding protein [Variovorax sp. PBL-E5]|uniref:ABC transporter substrate-binding protein n=1 Tax=Variovorax sp. PBL-E5 TaxID=434014 RepID=UPI0013180A9A|nr:ABC transporter substrate-binding protein [Variovorax sp. PBL-E5]VTU30823.1 Aliphatic amidase expression-regulating protein [Variovorax sp. PBL-E5]
MTIPRFASAFRSRRAALATGAAAALGILMSGTPAAAQDKPIKVGMTTDLTGIAAAYARSQVNGVQMAIDQLNANGGLLGRKLELLVRDSQLKPDLGTSHTRDLITRENVDFLIGPDGSAVGMTVSAVAKQYKKVVMMTIPNTPRLTTETFHPYVFTVVPSGLMEARAMAEAIGPGNKRIAFIGGDYEAAHQGLKYFKDWLAKVNPSAQVVGEAWPKLGEPDYSSYITSLMSSKPDVIFSYLWGADLIGFVKQGKPYGVFDKAKVASLVFLDDMKALGSEMPDGLIAQMRAPFFAIEGDRMTKFVEQYRARYNDYPADWAIMGYEGMQILAQSIKQANSLESDAIVKAVEQVKYDGLRGPISFRAIDHQGTVGSYIGTVTKSDKYPFKTLTHVKYVPAEKIWPTPAEIEQARAAVK